jgi:3-dehydroquinate synthase II
LENLIAQTQGLIAYVKNATEARTVLQVLERGVDGVLLDTTDINEIKKCAELVKRLTEPNIELSVAKIVKVTPLGIGDRVCIDTCTNMQQGEGMLVGNTSDGMFLVHSESVDNPYVAQRPFRINAGGVHAYVRVTNNKTKYLTELHTGDDTLIVNFKGETQTAIVGRIKIEKRPLMLVEGIINGEHLVSLILQNAETIRLCTPEGLPISVITLKPDDKVLAYHEDAGRHFGIKIDESIVEK